MPKGRKSWRRRALLQIARLGLAQWFGSFAFDAKRRVQRASSLAADSATRLILEINVREFPSAAVPHDIAGVQFLSGHGGGERRAISRAATATRSSRRSRLRELIRFRLRLIGTGEQWGG